MSARDQRALCMIIQQEWLERCCVEVDGSCLAFVQDGSTPLSAAASSGHDAVVRLLLESKAGIDTAKKVRGCKEGCSCVKVVHDCEFEIVYLVLLFTEVEGAGRGRTDRRRSTQQRATGMMLLCGCCWSRRRLRTL